MRGSTDLPPNRHCRGPRGRSPDPAVPGAGRKGPQPGGRDQRGRALQPPLPELQPPVADHAPGGGGPGHRGLRAHPAGPRLPRPHGPPARRRAAHAPRPHGRGPCGAGQRCLRPGPDLHQRHPPPPDDGRPVGGGGRDLRLVVPGFRALRRHDRRLPPAGDRVPDDGVHRPRRPVPGELLRAADDRPTGWCPRVYRTCQIAHVWRCHVLARGRLHRCSQSVFLPSVLGTEPDPGFDLDGTLEELVAFLESPRAAPGLRHLPRERRPAVPARAGSPSTSGGRPRTSPTRTWSTRRSSRSCAGRRRPSVRR